MVRMIFFLFGRPGAGKTFIGRRLAHEWGKPYLDGDDFYTLHDQQVLRDGVISDHDSDAFLDRLLGYLVTCPRDDVTVTSQSLFRASQRKRVKEILGGQVFLVYLRVPEEMCYQRLARRETAGDPRVGGKVFPYGSEQFRREANAYEEPGRNTVDVWYDNRGTIGETIRGIRTELERRFDLSANRVTSEMPVS